MIATQPKGSPLSTYSHSSHKVQSCTQSYCPEDHGCLPFYLKLHLCTNHALTPPTSPNTTPLTLTPSHLTKHYTPHTDTLPSHQTLHPSHQHPPISPNTTPLTLTPSHLTKHYTPHTDTLPSHQTLHPSH